MILRLPDMSKAAQSVDLAAQPDSLPALMGPALVDPALVDPALVDPPLVGPVPTGPTPDGFHSHVAFNPAYVPPQELSNRVVPHNSREGALILEQLIPSWAVKSGVFPKERLITVWIQPPHDVISQAQVESVLKIFQDAVYPIPVRITLPPSIRSIDKTKLPKSYSYIATRNVPGVLRKSRDQQPIREEIRETLPMDVRLASTKFFRIELPGAPVDYVTVSVFGSESTQEALKAWRLAFESRHELRVFIKRKEPKHSIKDKLAALADEHGIIRPHSIPRLYQEIEAMFGKPPPGSQEPEKLLRKRRDMTKIPFQALDAVGTRDREDVIHGRRLPNGNILIYVGYIDVTGVVKINSEEDRYARSIGHTIYGFRNTITTLAPELAHGVANFALGEVRPAWVAAMVLDGVTGEILNLKKPKIIRASVIAHSHTSPEEFYQQLMDRPAETENTESILTEAATLLRSSRMKKNKVIRLDGDSTASNVLAEIMIAATGFFGTFINSHGKDAIWRVQTKASDSVGEGFARDLQEILGVTVTRSELDDPVQFASIMRMLEDSGTKRAQLLAQQYLSAFFLKTVYSTQNRGHHGVSQPYYSPIKPRDFAGIRNQHVLHAISEGTDPPSCRQLTVDALWRNNKKDEEAERRADYGHLQSIIGRLSRNYRALATIIDISEGKLHLSFPGEARSAFAKFDGSVSEDDKLLFIGAEVTVALEGFNVEEDTLQFSVDSLPYLQNVPIPILYPEFL